jgi:hypothetical protein
MILGADWLEEHSPTWIHWKKKIMKFPHNGRRIQIQGITAQTTACTGVSPTKLKGLLRRNVVAYCVELRGAPDTTQATGVHVIQELSDSADLQDQIPTPVLELIHQYTHLFQEPVELPPQRPDDHHIPLIPGAQPINIRPYRYSPQQKTEIEHHIRPSPADCGRAAASSK